MVHSSQERQRIGDLRSSQSAEQRDTQREADRERHAVYRLPAMSIDSEVYEPEELSWLPKEGSGLTYNPLIKYADDTNIGRMTEICQFCNALKWNGEANGMCCSAGKIRLDPILEPPEPLKSLLTGEHPLSKHFLDSIRAYNSAFQMTSFGAKQVPEPGYMPTFKVQGQVYHRIGALLPTDDAPKFLQIYFVADYLEQANIRGQHIPNLNPQIITGLQNMLHNVNCYVNSFKAALESVRDDDRENYKFVISADRRPASGHAGRYNAPATDEVAVVLVDQECDRRDVVLRTRDDRLQRISETHRAYDSLQYPLMFCRGEDGYNFAIPHVDPQTGAPNYSKKTSALQFYSYRLQLRQSEWPFLHRFKGLFSQFIVDLYAKIETERLVYIRTHQRQLRAENYVDLRDAMQRDTDAENLGRMVILPSTFVGSDRYMAERTQDALCYARKYGGADLFITFTCNPKWPEIMDELLAGQLPTDRHDIVSRVFHLKQKRLIDLLTKGKVFGNVRCFMSTIEWQKRGLPHSHTLLWLEEKIRPNQIDLAISAELPDPELDPRLYNIIKTHMIHGPCGSINPNSPCMKNGRCTKRFPKNLVAETLTGEDGYPSYRRRSAEAGGFTAEVRTRGQTVQVDNRWVVPYSPVLSRAFETHLNVESCASIASIKYVTKYINKGDSRATLALQNRDRDEVSAYLSGRYISTSEAVWRTLAFPIHERFPTVVHLDVHLENGQRIYFDPDNVQERLDQPRQTTLLAFFRLCQDDEFARTLLYNEVPSYYTYNKQSGLFKRRRRGQPVEGALGIFKDGALGRVYTIHPNNRECYYLRLLLHTVRGPTSFAALRTVDGVEHTTFHAACSALHLLDDDQNWDQTLAEAIVCDSPNRLRQLFAIMLVFCGLSNPQDLWQKYQTYMADDILYRMRIEEPELDRADERALNGCLTLLQEVVTSIGGNSLDSYGLPQPIQPNNSNHEYEEATLYDREEMAAFVSNNIPRLNTEQRHIFDRVIRSVEQQLGEIFFLDAPGGTGKTFLTGILLAEVRKQGKIALAVASSGIAATLLPGGKTAHTAFKIPIDLDSTETPVCGVSRNCDKAKVLQECSLIVWDESTMANKKAVEAVDRMLQDIRRTARTMGGVTMLFCGDFRQTLPVVTRGTRADEVNACLKRSVLWPSVQKLRLTENMRVQGGSHAQEFARLLLKVGEGLLEEVDGQVRLPDTLCRIVPSLEDLIRSVYGDLSQVTQQANSWVCERAILTPKNEQAAAINARMLTAIDGEQVMYRSVNTVLDEGNATTYPVEFLNSLSASGLPAHEICLKVGVPIMLMRNLLPPKLCNGTRLKVVRLQRNLIEAQILTGCGAGEVVFIPRIPLIPNNFPFQFKRLQLPVSVCFAMTINKAQGQTLRAAGVDLRTSCFSHGQLYVACSRVTCSTQLFMLMPDGTTYNVVYKEIL